MKNTKTQQQTILFVCFVLFVLYLGIQAKEISVLLISSYFVALLLEPFLEKLERIKIPRALSLFFIILFIVGLISLFLIRLLPEIINQYSILLTNLPDYLKGLIEWVNNFLEQRFHTKLPLEVESFSQKMKQYSSYISTEQLSQVITTMNSTLVSGYSYALTVLNFLLFPIFVVYISLDLKNINQYIEELIPSRWRGKVVSVSNEILQKLYVFFKGQLTVALLLCVLYILGFTFAGLNSSFIVGLITGLLSFFPYLGLITGLVVSMIITFIHSSFLWSYVKVLLVFVTVYSFDGFFLTPKIIGSNLGISPLVVILALILGGKLLGLLGLIIAIPVAAALSILLKHFANEMNR